MSTPCFVYTHRVVVYIFVYRALSKASTPVGCQAVVLHGIAFYGSREVYQISLAISVFELT